MFSPTVTYELLLYVSIVVFGFVLTIYLRSGRASMFHPATIYLAFHFVTFVARPLLAYYYQFDFLYKVYLFFPSINDKITVILGANVGLIAFVFASLAFGNAPPRFAQMSTSELARYRQPVLLAWVILGGPALYSLYFVLQSIGRAQAWGELDHATGIAINTSTNGYVLEAQLMLATLCGMLAFVYRFRWWSLLPFAGFVILRSGTGGRGPVVSAAVFMILLYLYQARRRWLTAGTLLLGSLTLALFRLVGDYRGVGFKALLQGAPPSEQVRSQRFLESMDWANMEFFEYIVYCVPQSTGTYDYFLSFLQLFTEPIPRVLWTNKPIGAPIKMFNLFDYGYPIGATYSLPGAGWEELGWAGIVILAVLFAWIYGRSYNLFMRREQTVFRVMLYCALMMSVIVAIRDGLVLTIARQSLFYLTPVLLVQLVARGYRYGTPRAAPGAAGGRRSPRDRRREQAASLS